MKNYIGIDLGTTNSAICSFDGQETHVWKSPEQNDVTPSCISYDRRGNKYIGQRAYDAAPQNKDNAARLFKRFMGTKTMIPIQALGKELRPEECSAEVLKTLYGYLPEELRNDPETGTVITVPAAFNQMQKTATMEAAELAGIGNVALMQEPVAAIMSVMRVKKTDGMFLIYDFGGGTLDIAIAESIGKRVNLLAHGGIAMCGGRDFDRGIFTNVIQPWLEDTFHLPSGWVTKPDYQVLKNLSVWAAERAKIELSSREESRISLTEFEVRSRDADGEEIFLDVPLTRNDLNPIIEEKVMDSIDKVRELLAQNHLQATDFENIVFIGGPTNYKPLRDKVSFELGIPGVVNVNPMTAVAEGAAIYAESIDWQTTDRRRKNVRGKVSLEDDAVEFNYIARAAENETKIGVRVQKALPEGMEFQVDSKDTGWTSGRLPLAQGKVVTVPLAQAGANTFRITMYDAFGGAVKEDTIVIEKTSATISAIPASHAIGVEVLKSLDGSDSKLEWLVQVGDSLPKKGRKTFKATQAIQADSPDSLNFKLWEGEIEEPVSDNRFIGVFAIHGRDLTDGVLPAGADLICDYEVLDSGNVNIEISVPQIGSSFQSDRNFYSREEGAVDYTSADGVDQLLDDGNALMDRIDRLDANVKDDRIQQAREKVDDVLGLAYSDNPDAEPRKEAADKLYEAKRLLYEIRKEHAMELHKSRLDRWRENCESIRQYASEDDWRELQRFLRLAQGSMRRRDNSFDDYLSELNGKYFTILWQQDWFVIDWFKEESKRETDYIDAAAFRKLVGIGQQALEANEIDKLRHTLGAILTLPRKARAADRSNDFVNIIKG